MGSLKIIRGLGLSLFPPHIAEIHNVIHRERMKSLDWCSRPSTIRGRDRRFNGQGGSMARYRYQEGRVILRGRDGRRKWVGRFRVDVVQQDGTIKRVERSVVLGTKRELPTEKLARRRLELLVQPVNSTSYRPGRIATVGEFAERWKSEVLVQRKASTIRAALAHLNNHILPRLGKLRMDELGNEQQQAFVTYLSKKTSRKTVLNVLGTLSSMLGTARKRNYLCEQLRLSDLVLPPEGVKPEARFFTPEQVRQIITLASEPFKTMFAVAAMTGVRSGELLGLKADDLDFERKLIFIRRSVNRGQVTTVKSKASQKPLPMPDVLVQILTQYLKGWRETPERWLFVNRWGRPYSTNKVVQRKLWPILDVLRIPRCGLHAFRHFLSSMLLEVGASPQVAQAQLRHSDARITLETYSHVIGDSQRNAVDRVAELLRPSCAQVGESGELIQ